MLKTYDGPLGLAWNAYKVLGDTVRMTLSRGQVSTFLVADFYKAAPYRWTAMYRDSRRKHLGFYAVCQRSGQQTIYLHRLIADTPEGSLTDHADGDGLNNCPENLRTADRVQNSRNRLPNQSTAGRAKLSPFKGVSRLGNAWQARIQIRNPDGTKRVLRLGKSLEQVPAARLYDAAALEHFGPFAVTNASLGLL